MNPSATNAGIATRYAVEWLEQQAVAGLLDADPDRAGVPVDPDDPTHATVTRELPADWLVAVPDVVARLESLRHPRIADVGCGQGWSALALAHAFLDAHVDGLDTDPGSIADARRHAGVDGLDGRVRFMCADVTELAGPYDLMIVVLEALRDMTQPVEALAAARALLAPGGAVLVLDNDFFRLYRLHP